MLRTAHNKSNSKRLLWTTSSTGEARLPPIDGRVRKFSSIYRQNFLMSAPPLMRTQQLPELATIAIRRAFLSARSSNEP